MGMEGMEEVERETQRQKKDEAFLGQSEQREYEAKSGKTPLTLGWCLVLVSLCFHTWRTLKPWWFWVSRHFWWPVPFSLVLCNMPETHEVRRRGRIVLLPHCLPNHLPKQRQTWFQMQVTHLPWLLPSLVLIPLFIPLCSFLHSLGSLPFARPSLTHLLPSVLT